MELRISDFDVFYISYDEPNAEEHWTDLLTKCPWAKRVHGVKGFDAAHKECARRSKTPRFITVDGDNKVDTAFFDQTVVVEDNTNVILSWAGRNVINGLIYGNGGLKCWPVDVTLAMKTHEAADNPENEVEFCWGTPYRQIDGCYSTSHVTGSPWQAWRAGFREGVKMSLHNGKKVPAERFRETIWWQNIHRLEIWCSVGRDIENGVYAMLGARQGCELTATRADWDHTIIRDYDRLRALWESLQVAAPVEEQLASVGAKLQSRLGLKMADLDADASVFFKDVYVNYPRAAKK